MDYSKEELLEALARWRELVTEWASVQYWLRGGVDDPRVEAEKIDVIREIVRRVEL